MNEIKNRVLAGAMSPFVELVRKLENKIAGLPRFEWGVVTQTDPVRVRLESHAVALPDRPDMLVDGVAVGDRVRVERQGTRAVVHGIGGGAQQKILASGGSYMGGSQSWDFSEKVSEQETGIILVWSRYASGAPQNDSFNFTFVPKQIVQLHPGTGVTCVIGHGSGAAMSRKYVYIDDDRIRGNAVNDQSPNNWGVLRYVIGV